MIPLRLVPREVRLPVAARDAHRRWSARTSLVVVAGAGVTRGRGEAAPLPGYSPDSLDEVGAWLGALARRGLPELPDELDAALAAWGDLAPLRLPSARHALETAALDRLARRRGVPAPALLGARAPITLPLAALLDGPPAEWDAAAEREVARGARCVKLKVGRPGLAEAELDGLRRLRTTYGPGLAVRLDANRAWPPEEARARLAAWAELDPEWVEEPCLGSPVALGDAPVPIALDESLHARPDTIAPERLAALPAAAWVLKPTAVGGLRRSLALASAARAAGAAVVLSHTHEGPIGLAACAALALAVGDRRRAHGLAPWAALVAEGPPPSWLAPSTLAAWREPGLGDVGALA
ncbi:MAG: O-succinylbenzoate synthase [Polyangiaceae bacterium]|nr:O-succinylbenzoate synthase [Polyangiaceae bacterium]